MQRPDIGVALMELTLGYAHIAINVGSREAVDDLTTAMAAEGVEVLSNPRLTGDGYYESVIRDPEGNRIELTA